jgi:hypothetical protein
VAVKIRSKIASVAVVVIASVGLWPAAAQAERSRRVDVPVVHTGLQAVSNLSLTFHAGSCTEYSRDPVYGGVSSVTLTLRNPFGDVTVDWHGYVSTSITATADVWHAWFEFKNSDGVLVATVNGFDGPNMEPSGLTYDFHRIKSIHMNEITFSQITKVDWWGDC